MQIQVRLGSGLAQEVGLPRVSATLPEGATVADLVAHLKTVYPHAAQRLDIAVPVVAGQHVSRTALLVADAEVALLMPVAGGSLKL